MRETRSSGSVEGVMSNRDPYSDLYSRVFTLNSFIPFDLTDRLQGAAFV